ncbi:MAG: hypothetical protein FWD48_12110, partial [Oscillospiraceae bacterium]|nr:hypothetical protein [Oscillospiraceae bacterium]
MKVRTKSRKILSLFVTLAMIAGMLTFMPMTVSASPNLALSLNGIGGDHSVRAGACYCCSCPVHDPVWAPDLTGATVGGGLVSHRQPVANAAGQNIGIINSSGTTQPQGFSIVDTNILRFVSGGTSRRVQINVGGTHEFSSAAAG